MAFDRAKTLRAAEKYLEVGKIPAAIKEYCKIVENDPDDFTTLNMLGDLHVRVGEKEAAILNFARIAEHYRKQDFALKAIAMYKKIDRLRPHDMEIAYILATLYAQQDLIVEARAQYLFVADGHARANETQKALEVLRQIADLDPQNTDIRIKLADAYLKEGMKQEAVASFAEAGERLMAAGAFERALEIYQKSLEIDPVAHATLKGLLATHSARGTPDEAVEIIERASSNNPDDCEILSTLANAYIEAEEAAEAERITAALVAKDSFSYLRFVEVARLYLKIDKLEDAVRVIETVAVRMLAGNEDDQLLDFLNEVLRVDSDNVQALRTLVRVYWSERNRPELTTSLERLADAAQAAGLDSDERYALTQLTRLVPDKEQYASRLNELGGPVEDYAAETLPVFDDETTIEPETIEFATVSDPQGTESSGLELNQTGDAAGDLTAAKSEVSSEFEIGFNAPIHQESWLGAAPTHEAEVVSIADQQSQARARELESVDFYIAQGYVDIAIDTLNLLENQFGPHPDIASRREQIDSLTGPTTAVVSEKISYALDESSPVEIEFAANSAEIPEIHATPLVSSNGKPQSVSAPIDSGLAEIFEEFRLSEEAEGGTNGDYETHYNLGLAYKEMDLLEEAVEEFQTAVGLVAPSDGTPRYLQCCNLLGHCFLQKKVPRLAVTWFNRGLKAPGHSDEEYQALRFDLGLAYEQMGEINRALDIFTEIYGTDISYRGVKEKLHELQART